MKRHLVVIPEKAEKEAGFTQWVARIGNMLQNTGSKGIFYGSHATIECLKVLLTKLSTEPEYIEFTDWEDFLIVFRDIKKDDTLWIIFSRRNQLSFHPSMNRIAGYLDKYFKNNSFILVYPLQAGMTDNRYLT